ncbi:DUF805 domain-containing protein [Enterococcus sp. BWR-S5]|uniref:DUF805 domain-containing protein n=1 Tax=Enterococcus sp. BWR-S5 TaxID=2787714 RepID=UPI00192361ED|nr:DUF805 domain-containing protein [Enterococcus sp. BWR-S5]MBL1226109.1 DUF805 domain-containing protein [Enterococcus sp. BWR-S5]
MIEAYKEYWSNMTVMNARATRGQYWWPQLLNYLVLFIYGMITNISQYYNFETQEFIKLNIYAFIFMGLSFAIWLANFTVRARRLHDTNRSNWWILLYLIPLFGPIIMFVFMILPGKSYSRWRVNQSELS